MEMESRNKIKNINSLIVFFVFCGILTKEVATSPAVGQASFVHHANGNVLEQQQPQSQHQHQHHVHGVQHEQEGIQAQTQNWNVAGQTVSEHEHHEHVVQQPAYVVEHHVVGGGIVEDTHTSDGLHQTLVKVTPSEYGPVPAVVVEHHQGVQHHIGEHTIPHQNNVGEHQHQGLSAITVQHNVSPLVHHGSVVPQHHHITQHHGVQHANPHQNNDGDQQLPVHHEHLDHSVVNNVVPLQNHVVQHHGVEQNEKSEIVEAAVGHEHQHHVAQHPHVVPDVQHPTQIPHDKKPEVPVSAGEQPHYYNQHHVPTAVNVPVPSNGITDAIAARAYAHSHYIDPTNPVYEHQHAIWPENLIDHHDVVSSQHNHNNHNVPAHPTLPGHHGNRPVVVSPVWSHVTPKPTTLHVKPKPPVWQQPIAQPPVVEGMSTQLPVYEDDLVLFPEIIESVTDHSGHHHHHHHHHHEEQHDSLNDQEVTVDPLEGAYVPLLQPDVIEQYQIMHPNGTGEHKLVLSNGMVNYKKIYLKPLPVTGKLVPIQEGYISLPINDDHGFPKQFETQYYIADERGYNVYRVERHSSRPKLPNYLDHKQQTIKM